MEQSRKEDVLMSVAENLWADKGDIAGKILEQAQAPMQEAIDKAIEDAGADDEEREAIIQEAMEQFTEFMRRGINRGIKRTTKEFGRS